MATDIILLMIAPHYVVEIAAISIHQQADLTCTIIYIWQRLISPYQVLCNRQTLPWLTIVQWPLKIWQLVKLAQSHYSGQALSQAIVPCGKYAKYGTYKVCQGHIIFFLFCWWKKAWAWLCRFDPLSQHLPGPPWISTALQLSIGIILASFECYFGRNVMKFKVKHSQIFSGRFIAFLLHT